MKFYEKLNYIMEKVNATQNDLVKNSHLSSSLISRYCNGTRTPKYGSKQLDEIINALYQIGIQNKVNDVSFEYLNEEFKSLYDIATIQPETFVNNFNSIIHALDIKIYSLSQFINYDPSYLSKIRNEYILPKNVTNFSSLISRYIVSLYHDDISKNTLANLMNCSLLDIDTEKKYSDQITFYLCNNNNTEGKDSTFDFLKELDNFDIYEFYDKINYSKMKVPTLPFELHKSKEYYGFNGYKKSQEDMLKIIVLSKSKEDVFFYSNIAIEKASKDTNFKDDFIRGISYILKKGIHINMVHNLDRPFEELIIGFIGWIPLYMTGMIHPYYLKNSSNQLFNTIQITSGTASLFGISISDNMNSSKFTVSTKVNDVKYYKENSALLLKRADHFMKIYTSDHINDFDKLLDDNSNVNLNRRNILCDLPLYTIDEKLLDQILIRNKIHNTDKKRIKEYYYKEKRRIEKILKNNTILDELIIDYQSNQKLSLSGLFYSKEILLTENEFKKHLENIKVFKNNNKNYNYLINDKKVFKNINIHIINNKSVLLSKAKSPMIHFYITHPKLVDAISKLNINLLN